MNWYLTENAGKHVRQVVMEIPVGRERMSRFGQLIFSARYVELMENSWLAGFFRLDGDPGPYLLVRADGAASRLRGCPLRVGFTFFRMPQGGLAAIYVDIDSPAVRTPDSPHVVFEMVYGLDRPHTTELVRDSLARDSLHICVAEGQGAAKSLPGGIYESKPLRAQYDVLINLPADCRAALAAECSSLLNYHSSVPDSQRSFEASKAQMWAENPQSENPILPRQTPDSLRSAAERGDGSRRRWRFWT